MIDHDRRRFVRDLLHSALAVGVLPLISTPATSALAAEPPVVVQRRGKVIAQLVADTLSPLGGMGHFVRPGDQVVVKPNIGWDRSPELGANTHPEVVRAVIEHCLEAGAAQVRVFDNTCNDPRRCYLSSGIQDALASLASERVNLEHMDRRAYQKMAIRDGRELRSWLFYQPAVEADRFINLPVAKVHGVSRVTLGMKNIMGVIGGNRGRLHRRIDEAVTDINQVVHSDLTLVDATRIMIANGPSGGRLSDVERRDTLIASADIVAADSVACGLFGYRPEQIPTLVAAARRGLGVMDQQRMRLL
jgi:uncharacterized protein (DUF362 family)